MPESGVPAIRDLAVAFEHTRRGAGLASESAMRALGLEGFLRAESWVYLAMIVPFISG